jgi:hypothetical protein
MPVVLYCVEATWRCGEQTVRTHVVQTVDRAEALRAGRDMARGNQVTRVLEATGDSLTGVWSERVIAEFEETGPSEGGTAYFKIECREDGDVWSQVHPEEGYSVTAAEPWDADAA